MRDPSSRFLGGGIVSRLGGSEARALGLDLGLEGDRARWWIAACLLSGGAGEERGGRAFRALAAAGLDAPGALARAEPAAVASLLAAAGLPQPERRAAAVLRAARGLQERFAGSLDAAAAGADGLEDLGPRLATLARGVGSATISRLLRPLRDHWPAAAGLPLSAAARAAALHLGWIGASEDLDGEPGALRAALARQPDAPPLAEVEGALERLGRAACLHERPERCPLAADCPLRRRAARCALSD